VCEGPSARRRCPADHVVELVRIELVDGAIREIHDRAQVDDRTPAVPR
jgi:hypothetical protein